LLINRARSFVFTTGLSPADAAAALAALKIYRSTEGERLRRRLRSHIDAVRPEHSSAIVPIVIGDEESTLAASNLMLDHGIYIPAIRPPTVSRGTSRLRLTLCAAHSDEMIVQLTTALHQLDRMLAQESRIVR
jgi:8-amino-7-oxononanoate synthase